MKQKKIYLMPKKVKNKEHTFLKGPKIAQGMFSTVYQATCMEDLKKVAMKFIDLNELTDYEKTLLDREINFSHSIIQQAGENPYIVEYYDIFQFHDYALNH